MRWDQPVTSNADFTSDWNIATGGTYTPTGTETPNEDRVRDTGCTYEYAVLLWGWLPSSMSVVFPTSITRALSGPWSQGTCRLSKETIGADVFQVVNCVATVDFILENIFFGIYRPLRRVYAIEFKSNQRTLAAPSSTVRRTFGMQETDSWSGASSTITITDYDMPGETEIGSAVFTFDALNTGDDVNLAGVPFDLEVSDDTTIDHATSPGELPNWFVANNWHQHVLVQFAEAESPGDGDLTCVDDTTCLTLNVTRPNAGAPITDAAVRGVVLSAGSDLAGNRPTATLADYLEGNNATVDVVFDKQQVTTGFNDQLVTIPLQRP